MFWLRLGKCLARILNVISMLMIAQDNATGMVLFSSQ